MAVAIAWLPGPAGTRRRVAKPSVEEPDAAEPARPDLWGARVSNDPGLPDRQRRRVSGVTRVCRSRRTRRPRRLACAARRRRGASVNRRRPGPSGSRRTRFSSWRESMTSRGCGLIQPATATTRNCNTWGKGDIRGEPSSGSRRSRTSRPGERPAENQPVGRRRSGSWTVRDRPRSDADQCRRIRRRHVNGACLPRHWRPRAGHVVAPQSGRPARRSIALTQRLDLSRPRSPRPPLPGPPPPQALPRDGGRGLAQQPPRPSCPLGAHRSPVRC